MDETSVIAECAVRSDERLTCNSGSICFNFKYVLNNFFSVLVKFWMDECNMVIAGDDITEGTESIFNSLYFN